jgi:hypothetical protein
MWLNPEVSQDRYKLAERAKLKREEFQANKNKNEREVNQI